MLRSTRNLAAEEPLASLCRKGNEVEVSEKSPFSSSLPVNGGSAAEPYIQVSPLARQANQTA